MTSPPAATDHLRRTYKLHLALLLSYTALILYGSLFSQQFTGGAPRAVHDLGLLTWPRYTPKTDIVANLLIYIPIGFLVFRIAHLRFSPLAAAAIALALGSGLSITLETLQSLIPGRVSSILDLIFNVISTATGAALGVLLRRGTDLYSLVERFRAQRFRSGPINELGMTVLLLWLVSQLFPFMPILNLDQLSHSLQPLRDAFSQHRLGSGYLIPVHALNIIVLGCVIQAVGRRNHRLLLLGTLIVIALGAKIFIVRNQLSPEALIGASAGMVLVWILARRELLLPVTGMIAVVLSLLINKTNGMSGFGNEAGEFIWVPFSGYSNYMSGFADILNGLWPYWTFAYFTLVLQRRPQQGVILYGAVIVLAISLLLEMIQMFHPERRAELTDIITAVAGWLLAWTVYLIRRHSVTESVSPQAN